MIKSIYSWFKRVFLGEDIRVNFDDADYYIPTGKQRPDEYENVLDNWGDHIQWEFPWRGDGNGRVYGHCTPRPKNGQTMLCECEESWVVFIFGGVDYMRDPKDMFFATVVPVAQKIKETGEINISPCFNVTVEEVEEDNDENR